MDDENELFYHVKELGIIQEQVPEKEDLGNTFSAITQKKTVFRKRSFGRKSHNF